MATLDKIKICGIRSFGCEEEDVQTVKFQKPLTLILGENGCGKSTIIECLRYLTAQKEPAGKGTFVHDPSLTNRATVKGFVKLKMWDVKGMVVDLCRQVQATRTKKSLTIKSLDNVITRTNKDTKEKVSISNRCADFTFEISRIFGVSRSILENVIFCTQEDSHWPLETDQKLKEKFDQIFDSDKYNKCVNKVREKKKKIKDVLKNCEVELKYLKENKMMAVEKRRRIEKTRGQVMSFKEEIKELNLSLEEVENKLKDINEKELNMNKNHTMKEMKKAELRGIEDIVQELKTRVKIPYSGTDEELKAEIQNFNKILLNGQKEIEEEENKIKKFTIDESNLSNSLMKEQGILGQLSKEDEINKDRVKQRNQDLKKLAFALKINVSATVENFVNDLMEEVRARVTCEEEKLAGTKVAVEQEEQNWQGNIDKLREEFLMRQNQVTNKENCLKSCRSEKEKINRELNEMDQSTVKLHKLESILSRVNKEIKDLQESTNVDEIKDNIRRFAEERNKMEEHLSEVEEKVRSRQLQSSLAAELDIQKESKSSKDLQFRRLINKHEDNLKILLGDLPRSKFKMAVQSHFSSVRQKVKDLTGLRTKREKEVTEFEMKRRHLKERLKAKEDLIRTYEEDLYEICGGGDFEETFARTRKELEELQDIKGTLSSSEFMYQRYIRALQKNDPCCPLCHRDFNESNEAQSLVDELMVKVREVPGRINENKRQLEEKQMKHNKLLTLKAKHEEISILRTREIPQLQSDLEKIESSLKKTQKELNDVNSDLQHPQTDEALCLNLQDDMVLLDQLQFERNQIEAQIRKLEEKLGSGNSTKESLATALNEQDSLRKNLKSARQQADEFQSKLNNFNDLLQRKQSSKNSISEEINKIQGGIGQKKNLSERLEELDAEESVLMVELEDIIQNCELMKNKLENAVSQKKLEKSKNTEKIEKMGHFVNQLLKDLHDIECHNKVIECHDRKGIDERMEVVEKAMRAIEGEIKRAKSEREGAVNKINFIKKSLSNQELMERELEDNLRLRQKSLEVESLKQEVMILEKKFGNTNFDALLKEKRKLKTKEEEIGKNKAQIQGRVVEMENQVKVLERELLGKAFRNIDETYNDEYLKFEVLKAIGNDLDRYATTMEYAMMTYHKQQMTRVNAFIREYWRKIYQGNDIDYIEIQTDNIESTEKRRNYNYKVIQVKSDVHLDMRNRCSAGQKMLASLIIRLALAETFSGNCGILTLDEPTTNLDRKNIKNLARTLNEVLLTKQSTANPNFQLIVITHDEEFLQELMELDIVNEYVKVDRNTRGKTIICNRVLTEELNLAKANRLPQRYQYDYD